MVMESSGPGITVVVPGSADDPFSVNNAANGSAPAPTPGNVTPVSQPAPVAPTPAAPATPAVAAPAVTTTGLTQEEVDARVELRLREAQSGWDKRNQALQTQLADEKKARAELEKQHTAAERRIKLEGLRPEERERMQGIWTLEDKQAELDTQRAAVVDYHLNVERLRLFQQYHQFGVTEEALLDIKDIDKLESFCKDAKLDFFENGGKVDGANVKPGDGKPAAPAKTPTSQQTPYDGGGTPPAGGEAKQLTTTGVASMGENIKNLFG